LSVSGPSSCASGLWSAADELLLHLVTPARVAVARPLVDGLRTPTVAHDDRIWKLLDVQRTTFDEAIESALLERG